MAMLNLGMLKLSNLSENYVRKYLLQGEILIQHDTWTQSRETSSLKKKSPKRKRQKSNLFEHTIYRSHFRTHIPGYMVRVSYFEKRFPDFNWGLALDSAQHLWGKPQNNCVWEECRSTKYDELFSLKLRWCKERVPFDLQNAFKMSLIFDSQVPVVSTFQAIWYQAACFWWWVARNLLESLLCSESTAQCYKGLSGTTQYYKVLRGTTQC